MLKFLKVQTFTSFCCNICDLIYSYWMASTFIPKLKILFICYYLVSFLNSRSCSKLLWIYYYYLFTMLGIGRRVSWMLSKFSITELYPQTLTECFELCSKGVWAWIHKLWSLYILIEKNGKSVKKEHFCKINLTGAWGRGKYWRQSNHNDFIAIIKAKGLRSSLLRVRMDRKGKWNRLFIGSMLVAIGWTRDKEVGVKINPWSF